MLDHGLPQGPPHGLLCEVAGVGATVAGDLKAIAALANRVLQTEIVDRPVLSSWSSVIAYCNSVMAYERREQFRILFLDKKNRLIADEVQQTGTVDHTPAYPRDPRPSRADIAMTHKIKDAAEALEICVHDHIIIGRNGHTSLKGLSLI